MQGFYLPSKERKKAGGLCQKRGFGENRVKRRVTACYRTRTPGRSHNPLGRSHDSNVPEVPDTTWALPLVLWLIGRLSHLAIASEGHVYMYILSTKRENLDS